MGELEQIIEQAILKHSRKLVIKQVLSGVAQNVGETTCEVIRDDSPTLYDVRLNAVEGGLNSNFTVYPVEGSPVLVAIIENMKTEAVIIRCSEVEKVTIKTGDMTMLMDAGGIVFNGGTKGGLLNLSEMVDFMGNVNADMDTLKTLLATAVVAGGGAPLGIVFNPTTQAPQQSNLEDTKVKH